MRHKVDIYNYERKLGNVLKKIERSSICRKDKNLLLDFYKECLTKGLSKPRIIKHLHTIEKIAILFGKPLEAVTRSDVAHLIRRLGEKDYSEWTKRDYKVILKVFYRWLRKTDHYPEEVSWLKTSFKNRNLLPEEVLTEDEIKKMVEKASNLRDKALILVLYESGCRIGEILSLRIRNVQFDGYGAVLIVSGKTGDRRVRIIASAPKLSSWLENHPLGKDPNAPLWVNLSTRNRNQNLSYAATKVMLKKVAQKAEIKKRIYPHLFRHSRATFLANFLTEAQLKQFLGWVQDSKMASTYVHLSGRDVDNALLAIQGINVETTKKKTQIKTIECRRCQKTNSVDSKFCMRCGSPLSMETALKFDEVRKKADKLMSILVQDPEILERLLNKLEDLSPKKTVH